MNEFIKTLCSRASCKKFKPQPVSDADLQPIIEAGLHAPSGMNKQSPIIVVIRDQDTVRKLAKLNALGREGIDTFYGAPTVLVVLADRAAGTCLYDGSLTMGNLLNAAHSAGLGARWIHRAKEVFDSEEGKALLKEWGVEGDYEGVGNCIIGYPDMELRPQPVREGRVFDVG